MAWPRSDRALALLRGRGQVALCGFCLAEVRSCSVASAWPRSGRALWLLRGRGQVALWGFCSARSGLRPWLLQLLLCRARCLRGAVVQQVRGRVFCSSSFCSPVQFSFSVVHCGSGILVSWALGSSHCCSREYCHSVPFLVAPSALYCASTVTSVFRSVSRLACPLI